MNRFRKTFSGFVALIALIFAGLVAYPVQAAPSSRTQVPAVTVLMYHHISEDAFSSITISPQLLDAHLEMLAARGYEVVSFSRIDAYVRQGKPLPRRAVVLTFDDGLESFYTEVYPRLIQRGIPALNNVITGRVDKPETHSAQGTLRWLTARQIREMQHSGLVELGSHTDGMHEFITHHGQQIARMLDKSPGYRERIVADLTRSQQILEILTGSASPVFAFPFGKYDAETLGLVREVGFTYALTTQPGLYLPSKGGFQMVPRIEAGRPEISPQRLVALIEQAYRAHGLSPYLFPDIAHSGVVKEIEHLADQGVISGYPDGTFGPARLMTRAQFAKVLAKAAGLSPAPQAAAPFADVADPEHRDWVGALVQKGWSTGVTASTYEPYGHVTRQQMASFFVRALGLEEVARQLADDLIPRLHFTDKADIHPSHLANVALAHQIGWITGIPNGNGSYRFEPHSPAKRQQVARLGYEFQVNGERYVERAEALLRQ